MIRREGTPTQINRPTCLSLLSPLWSFLEMPSGEYWKRLENMKNKGFLYVWCVGYWENGQFNVPHNLYHLKFYAENAFKFQMQLSQKFPENDWKLISYNARNELNDGRLVLQPVIADDYITNDGQKETTFDFSA